jgi:hypothetical protein
MLKFLKIYLRINSLAVTINIINFSLIKEKEVQKQKEILIKKKEQQK